MKTLAGLCLLATALLASSASRADTKESDALAHAVKKPAAAAPATVPTTVQHLVCKSRVTRPLEQQGTGARTTVTVCEM